MSKSLPEVNHAPSEYERVSLQMSGLDQEPDKQSKNNHHEHHTVKPCKLQISPFWMTKD